MCNKSAFLVLGFLFLFSLAFATNVTGCQHISASGTYTVNTSLVGANISAGGMSGASTGCLVVATSNVTLDCQGNTITNNGTATASGVLLNASTLAYNITVQNCIISGYTAGIYFSANNNNSAYNNTVYNTTNGFLADNASTEHVLTSNTAYNCSYGYYLSNSFNTTFTSNGAYNSTGGFYLTGNTNFTLTSNTVSNSSLNAIVIMGTNQSTFTTNTIYNNSEGIYAYNSSSNTYTANTIRNNSLNGIYLDLDSDNNTVNANTLYGMAGKGVYLYNADSNTFTANLVYSNTLDGVYVYASSHNTFTSNNVTISRDGFGIDSATSTNNTFTSNRAYSNTRHGIQAALGHDNTFSSNTVYSNTLHGLFVNASDNNTFTGDTVYSNSGYGLAINNSANTTANTTHLYNNVLSDVYLATDATVRAVDLNSIKIDSSSGGSSAYTTLSINDTINANTAYRINWSSSPAVFSSQYESFGQKYINITNITGTTSIDEIVWSWTESEVNDNYAESTFSVLAYTSAWASASPTLSTTVNTLTINTLIPANTTIYAVVMDPANTGVTAGGADVVKAQCSSDLDCNACQYCSIANGKCRDISTTECVSDAECLAGSTCEDCICVTAPECTTNADCALGETCKSNTCITFPPEVPVEEPEMPPGDEPETPTEDNGPTSTDKEPSWEPPIMDEEPPAESPTTEISEEVVPLLSDAELGEERLEGTMDPMAVGGGIVVILIIAGVLYYYFFMRE